MINAEGVVKQDNRPGKNDSKSTKYEIQFKIKQLKMIVNQKIVKQLVWLINDTKLKKIKKVTQMVMNEL